MKKLFSTLALAAATVTAMAGVSPTVLTGARKAAPVKAGTPFHYVWTPAETADAGIVSRAGSGTVNVTLSFDSDIYRCSFVSLVSAAKSYNEFVQSNEVVFDEVIPGDYWLVAFFDNNGDPKMPNSIYVIKKVSVYDGEITALTAKPSDASKIISFPVVMADGKAPVLPTATEETKNNPNKYDWTNATVKELAFFYAICNDEIGSVTLGATNQTCLVENAVSEGPLHLAMAISPLDESWHIGSVKWMQDREEKYYFTCASINGTDGTPETNDPDFVEWNYSFAENPVTSEFNTPKSHFGINATPIMNGIMNTMGFILYGEMNPRLFYSAPKVNNTEKWTFNYGVELNKVEYDKDIVTDWGSMPDIRSIIAPLTTFDTEANDVVFLASGASRYGSPLWWNKEGTDPVVYPGNTNFATATALAKHPLGLTAPVAVGNMVAYEDEWNYSVNYVGLYGEGRNADDALSSAVITTAEGETPCDMDKFSKEFSNLQEEGKLKGAFSMEFMNDRNILIDDILGYNNLKVDVANGSGEDVCPPTFTMMQFRDASGLVDNTFEKAGDGVIELSGADFNFVEARDSYWNCAAPASVKVEYAPADSEDFKEIAVEEVPANFYLPEYGYFWRGSLKDVASMTYKGWYQVRLSMTDEAGNAQTQTIYPAFCIKEYAGIENISAADNADTDAPAVYYNLQGARVANPAAGIYIRVTGNRAEKVALN